MCDTSQLSNPSGEIVAIERASDSALADEEREIELRDPNNFVRDVDGRTAC
jgi:hypothetical protein